jgi:hypothetical protein
VNDDADPPRLSRSSGLVAEQRLAGLVEGSRADVGTREELAALEARLLPLIGPPGVPVTPPGRAAWTKAGVVKLAVGSAVVASVAAALYASKSSEPPRTEPVRPAHVEQTSPSAVPSSAPPALDVAPAFPEPSPGVAPSAMASAAPNVAPERAAPSETALIGDAQSALASNPGRALALCERHQRLYPHGVLVQEREVLAIEALQGLGRHAQAVARGNRFLTAFPGSAHESKIAAIVGAR